MLAMMKSRPSEIDDVEITPLPQDVLRKQKTPQIAIIVVGFLSILVVLV